MGSIAVFFTWKKWKNVARETYIVNAYLVRNIEIFRLSFR